MHEPKKTVLVFLLLMTVVGLGFTGKEIIEALDINTNLNLNGILNMNGNEIRGVAIGTSPDSVATRDYVDAAVGSGSFPSGYVARFSTPDPRPGWTYVGEEIIPYDIWVDKPGISAVSYSLAAAVVNGKIYAIGGYHGTNYLSMNKEYDPSTNHWTAKAPMPTARAGLAAAAVNGKIYAIGGRNNSYYYLNVNEEYDPSTNTWATKAPMPTARTGLAAAVLKGKIYTIIYAYMEEYSPDITVYLFSKD